DGSERARGGSLPVGARDQDRIERILRPPQILQRGAHSIQVQLDPAVLEREQVVDRLAHGATRARRTKEGTKRIRSSERIPIMLRASKRDIRPRSAIDQESGRASRASLKKRIKEESVERSSLRGTMRSIIPCSRRNSERWKPGGSSCWMVCSMTRGPANPMSAFGSARITSPRLAKLAETPPVVG